MRVGHADASLGVAPSQRPYPLRYCKGCRVFAPVPDDNLPDLVLEEARNCDRGTHSTSRWTGDDGVHRESSSGPVSPRQKDHPQRDFRLDTAPSRSHRSPRFEEERVQDTGLARGSCPPESPPMRMAGGHDLVRYLRHLDRRQIRPCI